MEADAFLNYIWGRQPRGYAFVAQRTEGHWREMAVDLRKGGEVRLTKSLLSGCDLYFCPNLFSKPQRRKELTLPSSILYQDLDESDPRELALAPELWWETSPGRFQAAWLLDHPLEPTELQSLNRALNRACFADPGTWNLTRLLRVPGSWNAKRGVRVSRAYGKDELEQAA